jgi:hypothetical protein
MPDIEGIGEFRIEGLIGRMEGDKGVRRSSSPTQKR